MELELEEVIAEFIRQEAMGFIHLVVVGESQLVTQGVMAGIPEDMAGMVGDTLRVMAEDMVEMVGDTLRVMVEDMVEMVGDTLRVMVEDMVEMVGGTLRVMAEDTQEAMEEVIEMFYQNFSKEMCKELYVLIYCCLLQVKLSNSFLRLQIPRLFPVYYKLRALAVFRDVLEASRRCSKTLSPSEFFHD
jgi:dihydroxyacetone kinase-like predicted kinase